MSSRELIARLRPLLARLQSSETVTGVVLSVVVGVGAGFGAVAFWKMIEYCSWFFFKGGSVALGFLGQYYVIIVPAIGGLIFGLLIYFLAPEAKGEGPPEVMEAVAVGGGRIRHRVAAAKILVSSICIGSGGSVGREGPIVQIGSSIGSSVGRWLKLPEDWVKTLVLCGAAGGISATFNAPIAGAFFAFEVLQRRFMARNLFFIVLSSVAATIIARIFLFSEAYPTIFTHVPEYSMKSPWEILFYAALGITAGLAVYGFITFFYKCDSLFNAWKIPPYVKPIAGGIIIGLIGLYYPYIFGVGYGTYYGIGGVLMSGGGVDAALLGQLGLVALLALLVLKMVATSVTLGSGGSGGVFAPSLFIGAMLGGAFGMIVHWLFPALTAPLGAYALVGMGAFFGAAVRGPLTAIIIVFEITRNYMVILPLIAAVAISCLVFRRFSGESIYTLRLLQRGIDLHRIGELDVMKAITVSEAMTRDFPTVSLQMPVSELVRELQRTGHHGFPVIDEEGRFWGCVALRDVEDGMKRGNPDLRVRDIATTRLRTAYPDQTLHDVLVGFMDMDVGRIPVVDRADPTRLLGVLRRHDIIRAYTRALAGEPGSPGHQPGQGKR